MAQHTPAPWHYHSSKEGIGICGSEGWDKVTDIATVWPWQDETDAANARLIAASPRLLAALTWITRCPSIKGPAGLTAYVIADERMAKAREAVAQASEETSKDAMAARPDEKLRAALEFAAAGFAVIANDKTAAQHSRDFARDNFLEAKTALAAIKEG